VLSVRAALVKMIEENYMGYCEQLSFTATTELNQALRRKIKAPIDLVFLYSESSFLVEVHDCFRSRHVGNLLHTPLGNGRFLNELNEMIYNYIALIRSEHRKWKETLDVPSE
jgi:hypothetical protein